MAVILGFVIRLFCLRWCYYLGARRVMGGLTGFMYGFIFSFIGIFIIKSFRELNNVQHQPHH